MTEQELSKQAQRSLRWIDTKFKAQNAFTTLRKLPVLFQSANPIVNHESDPESFKRLVIASYALRGRSILWRWKLESHDGIVLTTYPNKDNRGIISENFLTQREKHELFFFPDDEDSY